MTNREKLKSLVKYCTEGELLVFRKMYSHENLDANINFIIDNLDFDKVKWAIKQCENTFRKTGRSREILIDKIINNDK